MSETTHPSTIDYDPWPRRYITDATATELAEVLMGRRLVTLAGDTHPTFIIRAENGHGDPDATTMDTLHQTVTVYSVDDAIDDNHCVVLELEILTTLDPEATYTVTAVTADTPDPRLATAITVTARAEKNSADKNTTGKNRTNSGTTVDVACIHVHNTTVPAGATEAHDLTPEQEQNLLFFEVRHHVPAEEIAYHPSAEMHWFLRHNQTSTTAEQAPVGSTWIIRAHHRHLPSLWHSYPYGVARKTEANQWFAAVIGPATVGLGEIGSRQAQPVTQLLRNHQLTPLLAVGGQGTPDTAPTPTLNIGDADDPYILDLDEQGRPFDVQHSAVDLSSVPEHHQLWLVDADADHAVITDAVTTDGTGTRTLAPGRLALAWLEAPGQHVSVWRCLDAAQPEVTTAATLDQDERDPTLHNTPVSQLPCDRHRLPCPERSRTPGPRLRPLVLVDAVTPHYRSAWPVSSETLADPTTPKCVRDPEIPVLTGQMGRVTTAASVARVHAGSSSGPDTGSDNTRPDNASDHDTVN